MNFIIFNIQLSHLVCLLLCLKYVSILINMFFCNCQFHYIISEHMWNQFVCGRDVIVSCKSKRSKEIAYARTYKRIDGLWRHWAPMHFTKCLSFSRSHLRRPVDGRSKRSIVRLSSILMPPHHFWPLPQLYSLQFTLFFQLIIRYTVCVQHTAYSLPPMYIIIICN